MPGWLSRVLPHEGVDWKQLHLDQGSPRGAERARKVMRSLHPLGAELMQRVVPIFKHPEAEDGGKLEGSGFLVLQRPLCFLVSAAHVLKSLGWLTIPKRAGGEVVLEGPCEMDERLDVGVVLLKRDAVLASQFNVVGFDALQPDASRAHPRSLLFFGGFPASRKRRGAVPREVLYQPYSLINKEAPASVYSTVGADRESKIVLSFNKRRSIGPDGCLRTFPNPYGMSGSPLWLISPDLPTVPVVGVMTDTKARDRAVVGTNIRYALEMMRPLRRWAMS
jgi:hypothetical protein